MPPIYPAMAREQHVSGSVNFDAIIGADGLLSSLNQTGHADPALTAAAEAAVRQWIYRPFLICGIPVPVKTLITVNFNLSP
jgi:protein TonB